MHRGCVYSLRFGMAFKRLPFGGALIASTVTLIVMAPALVAGVASATPKSPKPGNAGCALIPIKDVRALFDASNSLTFKTTSFADAPSTVGGAKLGWNYNCTVAGVPDPNSSEETEVVTWFPGSSHAVYSAVLGSAYGLNTSHLPVRPLSGVGQTAVDFGNNVVVLTKGNVVALTLTPSGAIGAKAAQLPLATLKKAANDAISHLK